MGGSNGWRVNISADDWMRDIEKRIMYEERRPNVRSASDLLGPGFGPYAVETSDWSADETAFNGMFFSEPGAQNSPNSANYWIGTTEGTADGNGFELVRAFDPNTGIVSEDSYIRYFYTPPGTGTRRYTDWEVSAGGGGTGGPPTGPAGGDLTGTYPNPTLSPATKALMMLDVADEGTVVSADVGQINFIGAGVTASSGGPGVANVTIPGAGSGSPTGPAGGDLAGTYPNPTVAPNAINSSKIQDGSITSADLAPGTIPSSLPPSGAAGGDLTGTYPNPTVTTGAITSAKIADGTIVDGDVATANKDGAAGTPSMRTLGTGPQQAAAGNDSRIVNAASTSYVDAQNQLDPSKRSVRVATTAAVSTAGLQTIDGITLVDGDRVLVKNNGTSNTIYVAHATAWTVATDIDSTAEAEGAFVTVRQGTVNNGTTWRVGNGSVTDLDALFWVPYISIPSSSTPSGPAGGDLAGTYPNPTIGTGKVTSAAIADGTIQSGDIAAGVIPTTLPGPPTGPAGGSLSGTYPNPAIATGAVGSNQIADGSIQTGDIGDGQVTSAKIADNTIVLADLSTALKDALDESNLNTQDEGVNLNNDTRFMNFIGAGVTAALDSTDVTGRTVKVTIPGGGPPSGAAGGDLVGTYPNPDLGTGVVGPNELAAQAVTSGKIGVNAVATAHIQDGAVTTDKIADGTIAAADLGANSVVTAKIQDGAVTSAKIADGTVTAGDMAPGVIPTTLPPSGAAGGDLAGTYPNPTIGTGKVTSTHILDGTITDTDVATVNKDGAAATPSMRTLGTGAQQAAAGNDSRLSDARTPTGAAGGGLAGTYPNPTISAPINTPQISTPTTPAAGRELIYFKSDNLPYYMGPDGVEHPFILPAQALHSNPSFDSITSGKPTSWSDAWMNGGATLASDSSAGNVVAGSSAKITTGNGMQGRMTTANAFGVNDQQTISFTVWIKYTGSATVVEVGLITNTTAAGANFFQSGAIFSTRTIGITTGWTQYSFVFQVPAGHLFGRFSLYPNSIAPTWSSTTWFDESTSSAQAIPPASNVPIGATIQWGSATPPTGYLACDGSVKNITDYQALAAIYGTNYGGDGTTTFGLPNIEPIPQDRSNIPQAEVVSAVVSGWSVTAFAARVLRGIAQVQIGVTRTSALTLNNINHSDQQIGSLAFNWCPAFNVGAAVQNMIKSVDLRTSGTVNMTAGMAETSYANSSMANGDGFTFTLTYPMRIDSTYPKTYTIVRAT